MLHLLSWTACKVTPTWSNCVESLGCPYNFCSALGPGALHRILVCFSGEVAHYVC